MTINAVLLFYELVAMQLNCVLRSAIVVLKEGRKMKQINSKWK